jgi:hypothetical protein
MTTEIASAILDTTPKQVAKLCAHGILKGRKVPRRKGGRLKRWEVDGADVRKRRKALAR